MSVLGKSVHALLLLVALSSVCTIGYSVRRESVSYSTSILYDLGVLTIAPSAGESPEMADYTAGQKRPWDVFQDTVTKIVVTGYTHIGKNAFSNYVHVTEVQIDEGTVAIKESAFENIPLLTEVTLPQSLTSTEQFAFKDCVKLDTVDFYGGKGEFSNDTFSGCTLIESVNTTASYPDAHFAGFPVSKTLVIKKKFPEYSVGAASGIFIAVFAFISAFVFVADQFAVGRWGCKKREEHIVPA